MQIRFGWSRIFRPFFKTNSLFASDVNLAIHPDAHIILAPNIGSYVGGDITAGALVSMIWNRPEMSLFIDLGTNGELAFGNSDLYGKLCLLGRTGL